MDDSCADGFTPGESKLKLIDLKNGYYAVVIAGYSTEDTADAVHVFNHYSEYPMFKGTSLRLRGRTIL